MWLQKNKLIVLALLIILLVFIYRNKIDNPRPKPSQSPSPIATAASEKNSLIRTYYGVLPCKDCDGVETTLILTKDPIAEKGTYEYIDRKVGVGNASVKYTGDWTMSEGLDEDPNAQIIVIDPDDEETIRGFLVVEQNQIEALDEDGYRYKSAADYRLKLQ